MARFDYLEASSIRQAVSLLQRYGDDATGGAKAARIVAGSTDFLIRWRQGAWQPRHVISIKSIPGLDRIRYSPRNGLRLGTLATVQAIETHPEVRRRYAALATGATSFAGVQVRNLATVGGNICNASPAGDILPALLAFEAQCKIVGPDGERAAPLTELFRGPGSTTLGLGEILTEVTLPPPLPNSGSLYIKHSPRGAMDIATVGVASVISLESDGRTCRDARIALGAVAPTPIRAHAAEELLRGEMVTPELLREAALEAQKLASPIDDVRGSAGYRKIIVEALAHRTLERAFEMACRVPISYEEQRRLAVQTAF